jgi:integrase
VFHHALEYAVVLGDLDANPLDRVKWKPTKSSTVVDRRVVVNPRQARGLLIAVTYVGRTRGRMLAALFACMYFAGCVPPKRKGLREQDCLLPEQGWGLLTLRKTRPQSRKGCTDSGLAFDERGLKHREANEERLVPIPPELVAILRAHIETFGTTLDGRLRYLLLRLIQRGVEGGPPPWTHPGAGRFSAGRPPLRPSTRSSVAVAQRRRACTRSRRAGRAHRGRAPEDLRQVYRRPT